MNNLSENKEEIYLTSSHIHNKTNNSSILNDNDSQEYYSNKKKTLFLPPIKTKFLKRQKNNTTKFDNSKEEKNEISNAHSYFMPENYMEYSESCNKFDRRLDRFVKEKLSLKNVLIKNRRYDEYEKSIISDLNKDEMIQRSIGQGMFFRIQKYNKINRKKPYKPNYINYSYNDDEKYIKKYKRYNYKSFKKKFIKESILNENSVGRKEKKEKENDNIPIYLRENEFNPEFKERSSEIRPLNELLNSFRPPSFIFKRNNDKKANITNKIRDQKILMALMKSGDIDLKFNIGPDFN